MSELRVIPNIGSLIIRFGRCIQDNAYEDPIEWCALQSVNGALKLLSKRVLDILPFDGIREHDKWEECTIRDELNKFFMLDFTRTEQKIIYPYAYLDKSSFDIDLPPHSSDSIFLPSKHEVESLPQELRTSEMTKYCLQKITPWGSKTPNSEQMKYWTRDVNDESRVSVIGVNGEMYKTRASSQERLGVRPVIWINIMDGLLNHDIDISAVKVRQSTKNDDAIDWKDWL